MKAREAGGNLARASHVEVFVVYGEGETAGMWLPIAKTDARLILDDAKAKGIDVQAITVGHTLRIGEEHTLEDDGAAEPGPVCSDCGAVWDGDSHQCQDD